MKATRSPTLEERIVQIRADIEAIIAERVEAVAKESPGDLEILRGARAPHSSMLRIAPE
jgi:hypothetical protein